MKRFIVALLVTLAAGCSATVAFRDAQNASVSTSPTANRASSSADSERQIVVTIRDTASGLRAAPGSTARAYSSAQAYQASAYARRIISGLEHDYRIDWVAGWRIDLLSVHCAVFVARDRAERDALLVRLRKDARVESAQPMNTFLTSAHTAEYNDPYFSLQKGVERMQVPEAQQWSSGRGVTVAVIDTGVDLSHPELAGRILLARNFVDRDDEQFRLDRHGTAVAGVIAALTNNGQGIVGVAPAAKLLALKACWQQRPDAPSVCNTLTLAEALSFAIQQRARIINLSLTGPSDPLLARLLGRALEQGILVLGASAAAAEKVMAADAGFPLSVPGVIAVADADDASAIARLAEGANSSSQTNTAAQEPKALLAAPGREVLTLAPGGRYDYVSGASISTAMVSGVAALVLERAGHLSTMEVRTLLERTGLPGTDPDTRIVNACDAVASIVHAESCSDSQIRTAARRIPH